MSLLGIGLRARRGKAVREPLGEKLSLKLFNVKFSPKRLES